MPAYTFNFTTSEGTAEMELGFSMDAAAVNYARRYARSAQVEVWRGAELVEIVERSFEFDVEA